MATLNLILDTNDTDVFVQTNSNIETANLLELLFKSLAIGGRLKVTTLTTQTTPLKASGTVTISGGSGATAAVINGVSVGVTWATSDTNTATLLAAAINASVNALVQGIVAATSALGVVTISAVIRGKVGNSILLSATGTGATASGARLTAGTDGTSTAFTY